jgi:hypothetical protein
MSEQVEQNEQNEQVEATPSNMERIEQALAMLKTVEPPATSDEVKAIKAESDKLAKAREALAAAGIDTSAVDAKIATLAAQESEADAGRAQLVEALAGLERFAKILGQHCSGARVDYLRDKFADMIAAGVPEFPGPAEMQKLANGKLRAVHGARAQQIGQAFLNLSQNGRFRVAVEALGEALLDVDPTFGDVEGASQQARTVLQNFADVHTSDSTFVFSPN